MLPIRYVYGQVSEKFLQTVQRHSLSSALEYVKASDYLKQTRRNERILVSGTIDEIKAILQHAIAHGNEVAIIPEPTQTALQSAFGLSKHLEENVQTAMTQEAQSMDILYANDALVLYNALIGDAPPLNYHVSRYHRTTFKERVQSLYQAYLKVKQLQHTRLTFQTAKGQMIETVATGVVVLEYDNKTCAAKLVQDSVGINDSKLDALIISPKSTVEYLQLMSKAIFNRTHPSTLPNAIGHIQTQHLTIESKLTLPLLIDGKVLGSTPVTFRIQPHALTMVLPEKFWNKVPEKLSDKETIKTDKLPHSHEKMNYLQKKLPLFTHAGEKEYKTLFSTLRDEGRLSSIFMILMLLSSILATVGLYLNSASVVIGAMVLAPLMNPIVAFSMGLLRQEESLALKSFKTITVGICITLFTSALIAGVLPFEHMTQEMTGRIKPSLLDMIVAIVSGIAAAYVKNNSKIANTIAGVAIAVALVPPLATAGIGVGWGDWGMFYQAFLLFLTNLVGIVFAVSLVFLVKGFSPMHRAKKGLIYTLLLSAVIAIPLLDSFVTMAHDAKIISRLEHTSFEIEGQTITLQDVSLSRDNRVEVIKCELLLSQTPTDEQIQTLKLRIEKEINQKIELEALIRIRF